MQATDIKWFHSMALPDGTITDGQKPQEDLKRESDAVFRYPVAGIKEGCDFAHRAFRSKARSKEVDVFGWIRQGRTSMISFCSSAFSIT